MKSLGLIGFGVSNKAVYDYFKDTYKITVHNENAIPLPPFTDGVFGKDYLICNEDMIFRSPSVKNRDVITCGQVLCEAIYALNRINSTKISVTGSDGKTTVCSLIHRILENKNAFLGGNIGTPLINALGKNYSYVVSELSSFQLLDEEVYTDVAIITNITPNHLNYHRDMTEYIGAKESLLKNAKRIILNYDDSALRSIGKKYESERDVEYFSLKERCDAYCDNGYIYLKGKRLFPCDKIRLLGDFNISNVLASILATYKFTSLDRIENAACSFEGVKNRLECVKILNGVTFYNSSIDSTPSRTVATLSAFDTSKCVVILGGSDKNLSYDILKEPLKNARCVLVLGENKNKIIEALKGCDVKIIVVNTLSEAVEIGYKNCLNGDSLILSPASCSFDSYSNYLERAEAFKKHVNQLR